ncbi:hypothetical protein [Virgibacillus ainsalahensis]
MDLADYRERLVAINDVVFFDKNEYLREKTSNPLKINELIDEAENLLQSSNEDDRYFLYGTIGNLYRINEQPKRAINSLSYCLNHAVREKNLTREIVTLIRIGEAHKYDNNHTKALELFNKALDMCDANKVEKYLDFVLKHKGKCLMELARLNEAEEYFLKALKLRKSKGNASLIDSTEQAIRLVKDLQLKKFGDND